LCVYYLVIVEKSQADTPFDVFLARLAGGVGWLLCLVAEPFTSTPFSATAILLPGALAAPEQWQELITLVF
jgi:hypothetical protein